MDYCKKCLTYHHYAYRFNCQCSINSIAKLFQSVYEADYSNIINLINNVNDIEAVTATLNAASYAKRGFKQWESELHRAQDIMLGVE